MAVLQVNHLTKTFYDPGQPPFTAVNDVSFQLEEGENLAIIGESGSGKTTLSNLITGLIPPTSGEIFLDGQEISHLKGAAQRAVYRKMQMVFQSPAESFDPRRTLGDGICESLRNQGMGKKEALARGAALLNLCGLDESFLNRYPFQVSGGQCQRAAIARALAISPKLLILDEATSALDVTVQAEIIALLRKLRSKQQISYLFICHDIALVQNFCDRVIVMEGGKIIESGTPDAVIQSPKEAYTQKLIDSIL